VVMGELGVKCGELEVKAIVCSSVVSELRVRLCKAELEESCAKSAVDIARKELKRFEMEPSIVEANAAITQWLGATSKEDRASATKRYYKAIRLILPVNPQLVPLLPVTENEDILILIHEIFSYPVDSFEISHKFDEKHLCICIRVNKPDSLDDVMLHKIVALFGIFVEISFV